MLLDIVRKAAAEVEQGAVDGTLDCPSPIILNGNAVLQNLLSSQPSIAEEDPASTLVRKASLPWNLAPLDQALSEILKTLVQTLRDNPAPTPEEAGRFSEALEKQLAAIARILKLNVRGDRKLQSLLAATAPFLGVSVVNGIVRSCVSARVWDCVKVLLPLGVVLRNMCGELVSELAKCRRADLLCLCVRYMPELRPLDLLIVVRYFLGCPRDESFLHVRQDWKHDAELAISSVAQQNKGQTKTISMSVAEETAIVLAMAYDRFTAAETCLHFLVASSPDEIVLSSVIEKLDNKEVLTLLMYLKKWLKKYSNSLISGPPAVLVPRDIKLASWVPSLAAILDWTGTVLDKKLTIMIFCSEFHDELQDLKNLADEFVDMVSVCSKLTAMLALRNSNVKISPEESIFGEDYAVEYMDII